MKNICLQKRLHNIYNGKYEKSRKPLSERITGLWIIFNKMLKSGVYINFQRYANAIQLSCNQYLIGKPINLYHINNQTHIHHIPQKSYY